jgi:hypothetical protein
MRECKAIFGENNKQLSAIVLGLRLCHSDAPVCTQVCLYICALILC